MLTNTLITLFKRDLNKLIIEIESYKDDSVLWTTSKDVSNSAGSLCLHLIGNLNHFIGSVLGETGYVRKRDLEFSLKDVPVSDLKKEVDNTREMIETVLITLSDDDYRKEYPIHVFGKPMSTEYFLVHLSTHLAYHLGQINYHRRLLD